MAVGFGLLRLSPDVFWKMTPRELERAAGALRGRGGAPPSRGDLDRLMLMFPDGSET